MTINALLEAIASAPKPFKVVVRYECGKVREVPCHSRAAAQNHASIERRKIGRDLLEQMANRPVKVISVEIEAAQ